MLIGSHTHGTVLNGDISNDLEWPLKVISVTYLLVLLCVHDLLAIAEFLVVYCDIKFVWCEYLSLLYQCQVCASLADVFTSVFYLLIYILCKTVPTLMCSFAVIFLRLLPGQSDRRLHGAVVERWSLTGELSLSCARPPADGWPLMWVSRPL